MRISNDYRNRIEIYIPDYFRGHCNGSHIRWKDHIGQSWTLRHNDLDYLITVKDVRPGQHVVFEHADRIVDLTANSIQNKLKQQNKQGWCDGGKLLYLVSSNVTLGVNGYNALVRFKYEAGQTIEYNKTNFTITGQYIEQDNSTNSVRKYYSMHCNLCGWDGKIYEDDINVKHRCGCCANRVVVRGINDIATTDEWATPYFLNKADTYRYHRGSSAKVSLICPKCGKLYHNYTIDRFFSNAHLLNCPCGDTCRSYPERFVYNMFRQLNIYLKPQLSKADFKWCKSYKYDFYECSANCIIEIHGVQHYVSGKNLFVRSNCSESDNDIQKRSLAIANGITNYVEIDARQSTLNWMKQGIMSSQLPSLFRFNESSIDWNQCDIDSRSDIDRSVCSEYESNICATAESLSIKFGLAVSSIKRILSHNARSSLCNYSPYSIRETLNQVNTNKGIHVAYKDGLLDKVAASSSQLAQYYSELLNIEIRSDRVRESELGRYTVFGYTFVYYPNIDSYSKYVDFMSDLDNMFIPLNYSHKPQFEIYKERKIV